MADNKYLESFSIDVVGEITGTKWAGVFKCKTRLSHRDALKRDQVRRGLLGPNPEAASVRAIDVADILSEASVRLVDFPSWWGASGDGLDLEDDNVLSAVYAKIIECAKVASKELADKGAEARKDLAAE